MQNDGLPSYPIASVGNALRLLLLFRDRDHLRVSEAAESLGVARSTAHRVLAMLAHHGFVRQDGATRAYVAGPALIEIGLASVRQLDIRRMARPALEVLAAQSGETVHLAVLEGRDVRYLDSIESGAALRVASRTGTALPAHCTAVGKALLAELAPVEVDRLFRGRTPLPRLTRRSITSRSALRAALAEVRRDGYATNRGESEEGVSSVAMAVPGGRAGLSVAGPLSRLDPVPEGLVAALRHATAEVDAAVRSASG